MVNASIHSEPHWKFVTPTKFIRAAPTLAVWGFATATALVLLAADVPLVRKDILSRIPLAGRYFPAVNVKPEEED